MKRLPHQQTKIWTTRGKNIIIRRELIIHEHLVKQETKISNDMMILYKNT